MPGARHGTRTRPAAALRPDGQIARAAARNKAGDGVPLGAPKPEELDGNGARHGPAGRAPSKGSKDPLGGLLRGLRAGDLEAVLLTVAMAAEENRMPSADPEEAGRILAVLARLAEHDAALLPPPAGAGVGPEGPLDRAGAEDEVPAPR